MTFKIMRGALVGIILGVLFAISISGAIYMKKDTSEKINNKQGGGNVLISTNELKDVSQNEQKYIIDGATAYELGKNILEPTGIAVGEDTDAFPDIEINQGGQELAYVDDMQISEEAGMITPVSAIDETSFDMSASAIEETYNNVQDVLLRFHVKANSDSEEDIALKYKVRDAVLAQFDSQLQEFASKEEAISYLEENITQIKEIADNTIAENGYSYETKVYVTNDYFPMRQYGELIIPAGYYQALRIDIGMAQGENFWCILYPMMCYPIDGGAVITEEGGKRLKRELSEEEYEKLFVDKEIRKDEIEIRFKFLEWLGL